MELTAVLRAVEALFDEPSITVISDSAYVVNCFRDGWWVKWQQRGWRRSAKSPVAHVDLWRPLVEAVVDHGNIGFTWVKGHSGDPMNELVDRLAVAASTGPCAASSTANRVRPKSNLTLF